MEHLPDVPNPSPCIPLLVKSVPTRVEAQEVILSDRVFVDWAEDPILAASEAQKYLYFGLLACFSDCQLDLNLYIHDDGAYLNSHFNQYALGRRWLRRPTHDKTAVQLLLSIRGKISWLYWVFPLSRRQPNYGTGFDHKDIHLVCLSVNLLIEHIQTALSSSGYFIGPTIARQLFRFIPRWYDKRFSLAARLRSALKEHSLHHWNFLMFMVPPGDLSGDRTIGPEDAENSMLYNSHADHGDIFRELLLSGWCPSFVEYILANMSWSACTYLSTIIHPGVAHDLGDVEHGNICSTQRCLYQVNEDTYQTKHTMDNCTCAFLGPSNHMKDIVQRGGTPLLRLTYDRYGAPMLTVEEATTSSMYIAISHVWSGGLGNPKANVLPLCQLRQLAGNLDKVLCKIRPASSKLRDWLAPARDPLFWMDTLCIPVRYQSCENASETKSSRETRQRAINGMQEIYNGAMAVLVLDPGLQKLDSCNSTHQIYAHILTSSWMSRCWTFEEASMANEMFVQLKDQPYRLQMHQPTQRSKVLNFRETLSGYMQKEMMSWTNDLPLAGGNSFSAHDGMGRQTITRPYPRRFTRLYNTILRRSTSRESDRLIILSTMLNFRPIDVAKLSPEQRLSRVIGSMECLPVDLLYMDHEPELPYNVRRSWLPMKRMIDHIPAERPYSNDLEREENGRWRLNLHKNNQQCIFVVSTLDLMQNDLLVTIKQRFYRLKLWYRSTEDVQEVLPFHLAPDSWNAGSEFVLLVRDRDWLQNTIQFGTTACALFEHHHEYPHDPKGELWKVSYIMALRCSLKAADSSLESGAPRTFIRDALEEMSRERTVLEFPVPESEQGQPLLAEHLPQASDDDIHGTAVQTTFPAIVSEWLLLIPLMSTFSLCFFIHEVVNFPLHMDNVVVAIVSCYMGLRTVITTGILVEQSYYHLELRRIAQGFWASQLRGVPFQAPEGYWVHGTTQWIKFRICYITTTFVIGLLSPWRSLSVIGVIELAFLAERWLLELLCGHYQWKPRYIVESTQPYQEAAWKFFFRESWVTRRCFGTGFAGEEYFAELLARPRMWWLGYLIIISFGCLCGVFTFVACILLV